MKTPMHQDAQAEDFAPAAQKTAFSNEALLILGKGREATLATLRPDGWPQATVITYVNDDEGAYFACSVSSQKAHNLDIDDRVSLTVVAPYPQYGPIFGLSLAGHARRLSLATDISRMIELWRERHPYMPDRAENDPRAFAFYLIKPLIITMLDYSSGLGYGGRD